MNKKLPLYIGTLTTVALIAIVLGNGTLDTRHKPKADKLSHIEILDMIKGSPESAYHYLVSIRESMDPERYEVYQSEALFEWALESPESASLILADLETADYETYILHESLMKGLAQGWANKNIAHAFDWLEMNDNKMSGTQLEAVYTIIMKEYAVQNPIKAAEIMRQLSPNLQSTLINNVTVEYAKKDFEQALEWTLSHSTQELKESGIDVLLNNSDEEQSSALLQVVLVNQPSLSSNTVSAAFHRIAQDKPEEAVNNLALVQPDSLPETVSLLTSSWLKKDLSAAMEWVSKQTDKTIYNTGVERVASKLFYDDPAESLLWASKITEPQARLDLIKKYIGYAQKEQINAIETGVSKLNLSDAELQEVGNELKTKLNQLNETLIIPE